MIKQTASFVFSFALISTLLTPPAQAQGALNSQGRTGTFGNTSKRTNNFRRGNAAYTMTQRLPGVKLAGLGGLAEIHGPKGKNGLPQTSLDSFVRNAGGSAEQIYGDENADGPPPYNGFTAGHRIERGIQANAAGLTTGHGSSLPAAWGGDEFCKGSEFSQSGSSGGGSTWATQAPVGGDPGTRTDMSGTDPLPGDDPNQQQQQPIDPATSGF